MVLEQLLCKALIGKGEKVEKKKWKEKRGKENKFKSMSRLTPERRGNEKRKDNKSILMLKNNSKNWRDWKQSLIFIVIQIKLPSSLS